MLTAVIFGMCAGSVAPNQTSRDPQIGQSRAKPAVSLDPAFCSLKIRGQTLFFRDSPNSGELKGSNSG